MSTKKVVELILIVVTTAVYVVKAIMKFFEKLGKKKPVPSAC